MLEREGGVGKGGWREKGGGARERERVRGRERCERVRGRERLRERKRER